MCVCACARAPQVETLYYDLEPMTWTPVGVHKPHTYLPAEQLKWLYARCPPAALLANSSLAGSFASTDE